MIGVPANVLAVAAVVGESRWPVAGSAAVGLSLLLIRCALGVVFVAHGYRHLFGGGKVAGTARWFESLGMRPGWVHAWLASLTELGAGALLIAGLATPLACAGVVGTMLVAWVTNHLRNGFFIFRPGEGYEYVMTLTLVAAGLAGLGAGGFSLDRALGWFQPPGWWGPGAVALLGAGGAGILLLAPGPGPAPRRRILRPTAPRPFPVSSRVRLSSYVEIR